MAAVAGLGPGASEGRCPPRPLPGGRTWLELVLEVGWAGARLECVPKAVGARHAGVGSEHLSRTEPAAGAVAPGAGAAVCARAAVEGGDGWACCFVPELVFRGWPVADASLGDALSEHLEDS